MKSFTEIGLELGVSKQRAKQLYDVAMNKLSSSLSDADMNELNELLADTEKENNMYEELTEAMFQQSLGDEGLEGFWNDKEAAKTK
jgi:cytochrome c553